MMNTHTHRLLPLTLLLALTACGGGGDDAGTSSSGDSDSQVTLDTQGELHVSGTQLLSASDTPFLARGINLQYGDNPIAALAAIDRLAETGANLVRLQLRSTTTADQLKAALDAIIGHGMVAMPMYWETDITCQQDADALQSAVDDLWLNRWLAVLQDPAYQGHLLLNIANEWGSSGDFTTYLASYRQIIGQFRDAGFRQPLVLDGVDCGQNPASFQSGRYAKLLAADGAKNLLPSLHAYYDTWNSASKREAIYSSYDGADIPLLIGEFGDAEFQDEGNHSVDHLALMQETQTHALGWVAWSWHGNGTGYEVLDMSDSYSPASLTRRGNDIVYGEAGLQQTAQPLE